MFKLDKDANHPRETLPILSGLNFPTDEVEPHSLRWVYTHWAKMLLRSAALISLISVSANTPKTFEYVPSLMYVTFAVDIMVACLLTVEMITKMCVQGLVAPSTNQDLNQLIKKQIAAKSMGVNVESSSRRNRAYFQQSWNCFDAFMVFCLWASIVLQCFELRATWRTGEEEQKFWRQYGWLSVLRCPRPLILIRVFRAVLKLQLPPARVNAIFQRSTHQIYNVSVFLLFFMSLYGLLGVQFFGDELNYHCVVKGANESNLLKSDLAIPDSYCNPFAPENENQCPKNMKCVRARTSIADEGSYASFEAFHISMFTVYQASSQEGWVFIMYRAMDCLAPWKGVAYFITMIFMLAWLVKNVFIAVLTETFAEIRVQFQQMWSPRIATDTDFSKIFQFDGTSWKLVPVHERKSRGLAPRFVEETLLKSTGFNIVIMLLVLANAITAAGQHFNHQRVRHDDYDGQIHMDGFYFAEVIPFHNTLCSTSNAFMPLSNRCIGSI